MVNMVVHGGAWWYVHSMCGVISMMHPLKFTLSIKTPIFTMHPLYTNTHRHKPPITTLMYTPTPSRTHPHPHLPPPQTQMPTNGRSFDVYSQSSATATAPPNKR